MARSPFQGTYQSGIRPTVVTAPDTIVYINGEQEIVGCPSCSRSFDLNKYITSVQVDLGIDRAPGSASISLSIPRHSIDDFFVDGNPVIQSMMEVEIYSKGYYLVEGVPQYYPIFWGMVTEVTDSYSGGEHSVSITCADILKWWDICKMNVNAAYTAPTPQEGRTVKGNVFAQTNPYDIIYTLANQSFGDIIVGTGSLNSFIREGGTKVDNAAYSDIMQYWQKRFARMRSSLLLYGTKGVAVRGDTLYNSYSRANGPGGGGAAVSTIIRDANGGPDGGQTIFDAASEDVAAYRFVTANAGNTDLWQSEYQTKLEIANTCKEALGFEFYMDVTGDIVFKPPFYNLDVLSNKPVSWLQDIDIIDWTFSESESPVVTQIVLHGSYGGTRDLGTPADVSPMTSVTDYRLLRKYGWRSQDHNSEFLTDAHLLYYYGLDLLDRINSTRNQATVTIPMRPELRLGFPIYIAPKDQIWYIMGISHNISFGSRATTTLTLTAKRSKFIAPKGIGSLKLTSFNGVPDEPKDGGKRTFRYTSRQLQLSGKFNLDAGNAATLPPDESAYKIAAGADNPYEPLVLRHPKTGRVVGYPNVVMVYTRPFYPQNISKQAGQKPPDAPDPNIPQSTQQQRQERLTQTAPLQRDVLVANEQDKLRDKLLTNRYQYGLNSSGAYVYAHDTSAGGGVVSELLLLPSSSVTITNLTAQDKLLLDTNSVIVPVSDERGFEVIGNFQYGRRVSLKDGRLVITGPNVTKATVGLQLALSGDLSATLVAQSQGLTTVSTGYADPAATLATLTPDDTQTASTGAINPQTKKLEFVDVGDNFVDTAPLGSQEQKGVVEVEVSQLSRALTLTEMSVKDGASTKEEDCVCLTGRADLAFMNIGYDVQPLTGPASSKDNSGIFASTVSGGSIDAGRTQQLEQDIEVLQAQIANAQSGGTQAETDELESQLQEESQKIIDLQDQLDGLGESDPDLGQQLQVARAKLAALQTQQVSLQATASVTDLTNKLQLVQQELAELQQSSTSMLSNSSQAISKVDAFLVDLYTKIDQDHQKFEAAIRGDNLPRSPNYMAVGGDPQLDPITGKSPVQPQSKNEQQTAPSELAPPFSAPNRFNLGDVKAAVGAVESNVQDLSKSWSNFSKDLQKETKKTALSKEISNDNASITRLTTQLNRLKKQQESHAVVIGVNIQDEIDSRNKQIAKLQQEVKDKQAQLAAL